MAKRKSATPVMISKKELLLPKMEFFPLGETGAGIYIRELGGKSLLKYHEAIRQLEKEFGNEISDSQGIDLLTMLVQLTACNADGTPYFTSKEEAELFAENSLVNLKLASDKARELSGIGEATNNIPNELTLSSTDS